MRKHISIVLTSDFLARGLTAITGLVLIRHMDVSEFAIYVVISGFANMGTGALTAAFGTLYIVSHSEMNLKDNVSEFLLTELSIALLIGIIAAPLVGFFSGLGWLVGLLTITGAIADFARDYERQRLDFKTFAKFSLVRSGLFLLVVGLLIAFAPDFLTAKSVGLILAVAALLSSVHLLLSIRFTWRLKVVYGILAGIHRQLYFFLYVLFVAVFSQMDIISLRLWSDEHQIGAFGSAFRYYAVLVALLTSVNKVLLPHLPLATTNKELRTLLNSVTKLMIAGIPLIGLAAVFAPWVLPMIDKGKFPEAILTFQILCLAAAISLAFSPYANVLIVKKRFALLFWAVLLGLVGNFGLNYILIPRFGSVGPAIVILVVGGIMNLVFFIEGRRAIGEN